MTVSDPTFLSFIGTGFTILCGALSWSVKTMIKNFKTQHKENEVNNEKRMVAQEAKTEECEKDRSKMKKQISKIHTILSIVKECPADECPSQNVIKAAVTHSIIEKI